MSTSLPDIAAPILAQTRLRANALAYLDACLDHITKGVQVDMQMSSHIMGMLGFTPEEQVQLESSEILELIQDYIKLNSADPKVLDEMILTIEAIEHCDDSDSASPEAILSGLRARYGEDRLAFIYAPQRLYPRIHSSAQACRTLLDRLEEYAADGDEFAFRRMLGESSSICDIDALRIRVRGTRRRWNAACTDVSVSIGGCDWQCPNHPQGMHRIAYMLYLVATERRDVSFRATFDSPLENRRFQTFTDWLRRGIPAADPAEIHAEICLARQDLRVTLSSLGFPQDQIGTTVEHLIGANPDDIVFRSGIASAVIFPTQRFAGQNYHNDVHLCLSMIREGLKINLLRKEAEMLLETRNRYETALEESENKI